MRIRMLNSVRPDLPFLANPGTILRAGIEYEAKSNPQGAISGLCENGTYLGVRPGDFSFIEAPEWVLAIWANVCPTAVGNLMPAHHRNEGEPWLDVCPICGSLVSFVENEAPRLCRPVKNHPIYIRCNSCDLLFGYDIDYGGEFDTKEEAAAAWNRRVKSTPVFPLDLNDLQALNGQRVFIMRVGNNGRLTDGAWATVDTKDRMCRTLDGCPAYFELYAQTWFAFRKDPTAQEPVAQEEGKE